MKVDAIILGAELDGYLAAARLLEKGARVRILSPGTGSLHYAPGGIRVLGYGPGDPQAPLLDPWRGLARLTPRHPYRKIGAARLRASLDWFFSLAKEIGHPFFPSGGNVKTLSPAGLALPVFAPTGHQASIRAVSDKPVAVLEFAGHRDFPAPLVAAALRRLGKAASVVRVPLPGDLSESIALARCFDRLDEPGSYFRSLESLVPGDAEVVLCPAVLGLRQHLRVSRIAEEALGRPCLEIPTLPPSVPGLRLHGALEAWLQARGALLHLGARVVGAKTEGDRIMAIVDDQGEAFEAGAVVMATGGALMGGLQVDSFGVVREPLFGLDVIQTRPLGSETIDGGLEALHGAGVETDQSLRPSRNGSAPLDNLFVTGRMLGHWNPAEESSAEGVSIGTGWAAAEAALEVLGD